MKDGIITQNPQELGPKQIGLGYRLSVFGPLFEQLFYAVLFPGWVAHKVQDKFEGGEFLQGNVVLLNKIIDFGIHVLSSVYYVFFFGYMYFVTPLIDYPLFRTDTQLEGMLLKRIALL